MFYLASSLALTHKVIEKRGLLHCLKENVYKMIVNYSFIYCSWHVNQNDLSVVVLLCV